MSSTITEILAMKAADFLTDERMIGLGITSNIRTRIKNFVANEGDDPTMGLLLVRYPTKRELALAQNFGKKCIQAWILILKSVGFPTQTYS